MMCSANPDRRANLTGYLIVLAILLAIMYWCLRTLRFTNDWLNIAFIGLFYLLPILAMCAVLRLQGRAKVWIAVLLTPMLAISVLGISAVAVFDIPAVAKHRGMSRELSHAWMGYCSVHLIWKETAGGALGTHGVSLEQHVMLLDWLYAVRPLDYFEGANEGSIAAIGPRSIEVQIGNAGTHQHLDRIYSPKPWLCF